MICRVTLRPLETNLVIRFLPLSRLEFVDRLRSVEEGRVLNWGSSDDPNLFHSDTPPRPSGRGLRNPPGAIWVRVENLGKFGSSESTEGEPRTNLRNPDRVDSPTTTSDGPAPGRAGGRVPEPRPLEGGRRGASKGVVRSLTGTAVTYV